MTFALIAEAVAPFPRPLSSYAPSAGADLLQTLAGRVRAEPFDLAASLIFFGAIAHTFLTPKFREWGQNAEALHSSGAPRSFIADNGETVPEVSFKGQILHFLGEVEAVFGLWAVILGLAIVAFKGLDTMVNYIGRQVDYTEPLFVGVIMALASSRPIMKLAESAMKALASLGGGSIASSWLAILIVGPLLGSLITEPGAMTISAMLLSDQFYRLEPSLKLRYATLGLLFVNVSVGGTLTNFAAPPIIMVTGPWGLTLGEVFLHFGVRALVGIIASTLVYYFTFRGELAQLAMRPVRTRPTQGGSAQVPVWVTLVHVVFIAYCVATARYIPLFVGGFLFFLAFTQATQHHQRRTDLRPSLLVAFFLAGLVVHGGLQAWWLQPTLQSLHRLSLFWGATFLTSFNDNAAITYLATLVPNLDPLLKHAVIAGAVTGGGLTVIANAPNPAGQSILQGFFPSGVEPVKLALAALVPTLIMAAAFLLF